MKSFKRIVTEVAQPKGEDEIDFKAKHELELIDEPNAEESQFDGGTKKTKPRKADYTDGEDEAVYEETDMTEENLYEAAAKGPFTWEQINTAMMTAGFNPPQILKLLSALNKTVKEDVAEAASEDAKAAYRKRAAAAVIKKTQDNRIKAATGGLAADYWDKKIAAMKAGVKKEDVQLDEVVRKLDKVNHVHVFDDHPESEHFAKAYVKGHIGDHREGGPKDGDEKHADKFHSEYDRKTIRSGFAGSGTAHYTHKTTGHSFEVSKVPNGKTFYGTDHNIRKLKTDGPKNESVDADLVEEIGGKYLHRDGKQHVSIAAGKSPISHDDTGVWGPKQAAKLAANHKGKVVKSMFGNKHYVKISEGLEEAFDIDSVNFLEVAEATGVNPNREPNFDHNPKSLVISKEAAIKRIREAGLTIAKAVNMSDNDLLKHPSIGRKTLRWIRDFKVTEETLAEAAAFASGTVKFGDGKTGTVKPADADLLNALYAKLEGDSKAEVHKHAMSNAKNFADVVSFASTTVGKK